MPRGGSKKGGNNNVLTQCTATPAEISNLASLALSVFNMPTPDLHDPEQVQAAIIAYFQTCIDHGTRPGNLGLYAALGLSRQDYNNIVAGKSKSKASPMCIDMMKKATRAVGAYREGLALEGKINPVTYIFMGKNYDHLSDTQQIEVTATQGPAANMTPDQVAKQIEADIPIDSTCTETDPD